LKLFKVFKITRQMCWSQILKEHDPPGSRLNFLDLRQLLFTRNIMLVNLQNQLWLAVLVHQLDQH